MAKYIETYESVVQRLDKFFRGTVEKNVHVNPAFKYKFGYGAEIENIDLVDRVKLVGLMSVILTVSLHQRRSSQGLSIFTIVQAITLTCSGRVAVR